MISATRERLNICVAHAGWPKTIEILRDLAMHHATDALNQTSPKREILYYLSKTLEGALGLAKLHDRVDEEK